MTNSIGDDGETLIGTVKAYSQFDCENDCNALRKAMKGLGTNENAIIAVISKRSNAQRCEIKKLYKTMFGKDLIDELKSELSGNFGDAVLLSMYDPIYQSAYSFYKAMKGLGTDEVALTEMLCVAKNEEIQDIKDCFKKWFKKDLESEVKSETSGFYRRVLIALLQGNRDELTNSELDRLFKKGPDSVIDREKARRDANELYEAGEKKLGTDEVKFISIFCMRNIYHLRAVFDEYELIAGRNILDSIDRETSGDFQEVLKSIALRAMNQTCFFAIRLKKSMKGAGTDDSSLSRILITRSEIDLENIKDAYFELYGKTLADDVKSDTSGDYQKFLMNIIGAAK